MVCPNVLMLLTGFNGYDANRESYASDCGQSLDEPPEETFKRPLSWDLLMQMMLTYEH